MGHTGTGPVGSSNSPVEFEHAGFDAYEDSWRNSILAFVADDGAAMSYQSMGQYRSALLRILGSAENAGVKCDMPTGPCACGAWHSVRDEMEGNPIGWKIVATGDDGSVLCQSPSGQRARYWFQGKST